MQTKWYDSRGIWLTVGLIGGLCVAFVWPHERALASTSDRSQQFAMITVPVGLQGAGLHDPLEGIFVLDFLTGQLKGAVLNRNAGMFAAQYYRNIADDFKLPPKAEPQYAISTGIGQLAGRGGLTYASGVIYVGELKSGKVVCYAFPWREARV
jgi:hypothetical protein